MCQFFLYLSCFYALTRMSSTRKRKQSGAGFFDFFTTKTNNTTVSNLKSKRNYNLAHSKSRVSNILSSPGTFKYTNKAAIEQTYQNAIAELKTMEKPKETSLALQQLSASIDSALRSQSAREAGAVVITVPVGVAQLALKALRLFLSVMVIVFVDLPLGILSGSMAVNLAAAVAPNKSFETTASMYQKARQLTGANKPVTVQNFA